MFPLLNPSAPQLVCSNYEVVAVSNNEQYEIDKIYTLNAFAGYALRPIFKFVSVRWRRNIIYICITPFLTGSS